MFVTNPKIQKLLGTIMIMLMLVPSFTFFFAQPKKVEAGGWPTFDALANIKLWKQVAIEIGKESLRRVARRLLNRMTQNVVNWINSDFHGNPLYIENPKSFFNDIAKQELRNVIDIFGYDANRFPYGKDFAKNLVYTYQKKIEDNAAYSLSRVVNDPTFLQSYRNNFNVGGINGFFINTQYPQNNYLGFNMMATQELASRIQGTYQSSAEKIQETLNQSGGFLSPQVCPSNPAYNNLKNEFQRPTYKPVAYPELPAPVCAGGGGPDDSGVCPDGESEASRVARADVNARWEMENFAAKTAWEKTNTCPGGLVATTPGSVVGSHIMTALNSKFAQTELGAALGNSLGTIFDALLNHFLDKGLNSLFNRNGEEPDSEDWLSGIVGSENDGADTGAGSCIAYINTNAVEQYRNEVVAAQQRALARDPGVAEASANERQYLEMYRDLVISELQIAGLQASATYNGNCNVSPNNIAVGASPSSTGEIYDIVREDATTIREAATAVGRPFFNGVSSWDFITNGKPEDSTQPGPPPTIEP